MGTVGSAGEAIAGLLRVLGGLNIPFDYERSFKVSRGQLFSNRFLLSGRKRDFEGSAVGSVLQVCRSLGMPQEHLDTIGFHLPAVENVHFGFEQDARGCMYKVYLEFTTGIELIDKPDGRPEPVLLYLAYKWGGAADARGAVTRYLWYPMNSAGEILSMVSQVYKSGGGDEGSEITQELLGLVGSKMPVKQVQYLEVREDVTGRRSFDLNFYDAGLMVKEIYPLLIRMCRYHGLGLGCFQRLYDQIKGARVGHLSSGRDREGAGFCSIYHGACVGDGFSQALKDARGAG